MAADAGKRHDIAHLKDVSGVMRAEGAPAERELDAALGAPRPPAKFVVQRYALSEQLDFAARGERDERERRNIEGGIEQPATPRSVHRWPI
jgi:hypothetical protein